MRFLFVTAPRSGTEARRTGDDNVTSAATINDSQPDTSRVDRANIRGSTSRVLAWKIARRPRNRWPAAAGTKINSQSTARRNGENYEYAEYTTAAGRGGLNWASSLDRYRRRRMETAVRSARSNTENFSWSAVD